MSDDRNELPPGEAMNYYFSAIPLPYEDDRLYAIVNEIIALIPEGRRDAFRIQYQDLLTNKIARYATEYGLGTAAPHILRKAVDALDARHMSASTLRIYSTVLREQNSDLSCIEESDVSEESYEECPTDPQIPSLKLVPPYDEDEEF